MSQVGALTPVFAGIALAFKKRRELALALTWVGDGATKTTAFHEGINLAAVLHLPAIFVLQNNQIALGTRLDQHQVGPFTAWSKAYGVTGFTCDGNNVLDVYAATKVAADLVRSGQGPAIIFAETFRMGGHATHDEREARESSREKYSSTGENGIQLASMNPIWNVTAFPTQSRGRRAARHRRTSGSRKEALASYNDHMPNPSEATRGVYAEPDGGTTERSTEPAPPKAGSNRKTPSK